MIAAYPIPDAALDDRIGWVGTAGSGKTYNAGAGVERLLASGARCIICDPLDVWFGLRLMADGKTPSPYRIVILGGAHADLALNEHAGALIGETVATAAESFIVSMGALGSKAAERRFMLAFLTALYKHASGEPVHVIFDEADMWAPQRLLDKEGEAAKLLGQMETIVRRGRVKGFIPWLITQRPAVLSKDVLSQVDGLVAFKLTSSQDREALGAWIEGQADRQQGKDILASLPAMQRGQGVAWVPARGVLKTAAFPAKLTFDSSRTPRRGETKRAATLSPVDISALRASLVTVEAEIAANDPRRLKQRIAELERAAGNNRQISSDPDEIRRLTARVAALTEERDMWLRISYEKEQTLGLIRTALANQGADSPALRTGAVSAPAPASPASESRKSIVATSDTIRPPTNGAAATLSGGERKILAVLAQYPGGRAKRQLAILAGYAIGGGGFNNYLGALRGKTYLAGAGTETMRITEAGIAALGPFDPLPSGDALLAHWLGQLSKAERSALEVLSAAYPGSLSKEECARQAGYEPAGGGWNNALSRLRTLGLVVGRGQLRASEELFE